MAGSDQGQEWPYGVRTPTPAISTEKRKLPTAVGTLRPPGLSQAPELARTASPNRPTRIKIGRSECFKCVVNDCRLLA